MASLMNTSRKSDIVASDAGFRDTRRRLAPAQLGGENGVC